MFDVLLFTLPEQDTDLGEGDVFKHSPCNHLVLISYQYHSFLNQGHQLQMGQRKPEPMENILVPYQGLLERQLLTRLSVI